MWIPISKIPHYLWKLAQSRDLKLGPFDQDSPSLPVWPQNPIHRHNVYETQVTNKQVTPQVTPQVTSLVKETMKISHKPNNKPSHKPSHKQSYQQSHTSVLCWCKKLQRKMMKANTE